MTIEWAIIAFITLSIAYIVWRGGAANPESTGKIGRRVTGLSIKVNQIDDRMTSIEDKVDKLEEHGATATDIANLEAVINEKLNTIRAEAAGHRALSEATSRNVQRIYDTMLEKGLSGK